MHENRSYFAALIIVAMAAPVAALLFVAALVIWLAELMGSLLYPCLIVGAFMALVTMVVYYVSLRNGMRELHERISVIYDVSTVLIVCKQKFNNFLVKKTGFLVKLVSLLCFL